MEWLILVQIARVNCRLVIASVDIVRPAHDLRTYDSPDDTVNEARLLGRRRRWQRTISLEIADDKEQLTARCPRCALKEGVS